VPGRRWCNPIPTLPTRRAELPAKNMNAFYEAFDISPGDAMCLPPGDRLPYGK
jgi:predicted metalloendopeptidase